MAVVVWAFENYFSFMTPYPPEVSNQIERVYIFKQTCAIGRPSTVTTKVDLGHFDKAWTGYSINIDNLEEVEELSGRQTSVQRIVCPQNTVSAKGYVWEYEGDNPGSLLPFDLQTMEILEDARDRLHGNRSTRRRSAAASVVDLKKHLGLPYEINIKNHTQKRVDTGKVRKIQRQVLMQKYAHDVLGTSAPLRPGPRPQSSQQLQSGKPSTSGQSKSKKQKVSNRETLPKVHKIKISTSNLKASSLESLLEQFLVPIDMDRIARKTVMQGEDKILDHGKTMEEGEQPTVAPKENGAEELMHEETDDGHNQAEAEDSEEHAKDDEADGAKAEAAESEGDESESEDEETERSYYELGADDDYEEEDMDSVAVNGDHKEEVGTSEAKPTRELGVLREDDPEECCICLEPLMSTSAFADDGDDGDAAHAVVMLSSCYHCMHRLCVLAMCKNHSKNNSLQCPYCKHIYGEKKGICPSGVMTWEVLDDIHLEGYEGYATISVSYDIRSGVQGPEHPSPGQPYWTSGFPRVGYLPDSDQGRRVLKLLITAWRRRLTFTVGQSITTGASNTVTWNEIHHKTELRGNYSGHGYPDPAYLDNVTQELIAHGVRVPDSDL